MNAQRKAVWMFAVLLVLVGASSAYSVEFYDHPQIGRYQGSWVIHQESSSFSRYILGVGPARDGKVVETLSVAGKLMMSLYAGPENASSFEIFSAYQKLLQSKGFEVLFACEKSECGQKYLGAFYELAPFANDPGWNHSAPITQGNESFSYVLTARSRAGGRVTYVGLIVSQGWWRYPVYKLDVVEVQEEAGRISSVTGPGEEPGAAPGAAEAPGKVLRRPPQFGVQMSSDGYFGLIFCANRYELCLKAKAVLYDGFLGDVWPDNNSVKIGAHTGFLFRPSDPVDISVGAEAHHAIKIAGPKDYTFYLRVGLRVGLNYHLGKHFMITGIVHPVWIETTETSVADSYQLTATIPTASVAVSVFF